MSSSDILPLLKQAANDVAGKPFEGLSKTTAIADMELDSIAAFEFVAYLEEKLKIRISDEDLAGVTTLGDLDAVIRRSTSR